MIEKILELLSPYSPKQKGNRIQFQCPQCNRDSGYCYPRSGYFSYLICGHKNSCQFRHSVRDFFKLDFQEVLNSVNGYKPYFESHGLDVAALIASGIIGEDLSFRIIRADGKVFYKKIGEVNGKTRWLSTSGYNAEKYGGFYPANKTDEDETTLYVFAGESDWLKGIQDGLSCTSSIMGETYIPKEIDLPIFADFPTIRICYDLDSTGRGGSGKLAMALRKVFPLKSIEVVRLSFAKEHQGKDYCDFRLHHSLEEFRSIPPVPVDRKFHNLIQEEQKAEKLAKKKKEIDEHGPLFSKVIAAVGKEFLVTDRGIFKVVEYDAPFSQDSVTDHVKICEDAVMVVERLQGTNGGQAYVKVEWSAESGRKNSKSFPMECLSAKNFDYLSATGMRVLSANAKDMATYFLAAVNQAPEKSIAMRNGWQSRESESFVVGDKVVTKESCEAIEKPENGPSLSTAGDAALWKDTIFQFSDDPQVQIMLGASIIAPWIEQLSVENCTFHLWSDSGCGKTFLLGLAASIWGEVENNMGTGIMRSWHSSIVGHELYFHGMKNVPCFLDEAHLCHPEILEKTAYQFGNGCGKSRGTKSIELAELKNWKTFLLSTGEKRITESTTMGGIGARTIEIFRKKHREISEVEFRTVRLILKKNYGHGAVPILQYILRNKESVEQRFVDILLELNNNPKILEHIAQNDGLKRLLPRWAAVILGAQIGQTLFGWEFDKEKVFAEILDSMNKAHEKPTQKLYSILFEIYISNQDRFGYRMPGGEIKEVIGEFWGFKYEKEDSIFFFPSILKRELEKRGYTMSQLSLCNEVKKDSMGKNSVVVSIKGKSLRMICLQLGKNEDAIENVEQE